MAYASGKVLCLCVCVCLRYSVCQATALLTAWTTTSQASTLSASLIPTLTSKWVDSKPANQSVIPKVAITYKTTPYWRNATNSTETSDGPTTTVLNVTVSTASSFWFTTSTSDIVLIKDKIKTYLIYSSAAFVILLAGLIIIFILRRRYLRKRKANAERQGSSEVNLECEYNGTPSSVIQSRDGTDPGSVNYKNLEEALKDDERQYIPEYATSSAYRALTEADASQPATGSTKTETVNGKVEGQSSDVSLYAVVDKTLKKQKS